jgi:hypothetical protein
MTAIPASTVVATGPSWPSFRHDESLVFVLCTFLDFLVGQLAWRMIDFYQAKYALCNLAATPCDLRQRVAKFAHRNFCLVQNAESSEPG